MFSKINPEQKKTIEAEYRIDSQQVFNFCAKFGCAKKLSLVESLAGKYCTNHLNEKPVDIMKVLKFK